MRESEPVPWEWLAAVHDADAAGADPARGRCRVREQRGLGLPWSEVLVERGRRSVGGTLAAARRALAHGIGMNLGGGTHHAGRDFARGYCLFNDVAVDAGAAARRGPGAARAGRRLRRPPGRRHRADPRPGPGRVHALAARRAQLPVRAHPVRPRRRPAERHRRRRVPARARRTRWTSRSDAGARRRVLPRRRRPVGGRPARPPRADQGRPARARRARARPPARARARRSCVVLAGGYAPDVRDTVDINAATVAAVAALAS